LYNWERINKEKPVELGNIRLLNNFALTHKSHEDWFVLIHVDIEAKAARAIVKIWEFLQVIQKDTIGVLQCLASIFSSLTEMNRTFKRMPEACHPDVYYNKVRPYIFGFNEVVYEGAEPKTLTLRGETGAQSSILPAFDAFLGIKHTNSILTKHLEEMLQYMPYEHVEFINSIKNSKIDFRDMCAKKPETRDLYNACIEKIIEFRAQHLEYAVEYIQKRVENPTGTGGTPFIPWLDQLRSETEKFFIKGNGHG
jgi:indoleamine 2,3-dioxygenase